jgi:hypothetical protein
VAAQPVYRLRRLKVSICRTLVSTREHPGSTTLWLRQKRCLRLLAGLCQPRSRGIEAQTANRTDHHSSINLIDQFIGACHDDSSRCRASEAFLFAVLDTWSHERFSDYQRQ